MLIKRQEVRSRCAAVHCCDSLFVHCLRSNSACSLLQHAVWYVSSSWHQLRRSAPIQNSDHNDFVPCPSQWLPTGHHVFIMPTIELNKS